MNSAVVTATHDDNVETISHTVSSVIVTSSQPLNTSREELIDDDEEVEEIHLSSTANEQNEQTNSAASIVLTIAQPIHTSRDELIEDEAEIEDHLHLSEISSDHLTDHVRTVTTNDLPREIHEEAYTNPVALSTVDENPDSSALSSVIVTSGHSMHSSQDDLLAAE